MTSQLKALLAVTCCAMVSCGGLLARADKPAVSGPNARFSVEGGSIDSESAGLALGSYTMPLGHRFGLQVDGALGVIDNEVLGGTGLHLFTRNPDRYLFGFYGSYHTWNSIDIWRAGAEVELYLNRFSLSGVGGYERLEAPTTVAGVAVVMPETNRVFLEADLGYYITDNFKVYGGYRLQDDISFAGAGAEYLLQTGGVPMSLFARGSFGESDYTRITGGVRVYFGADPGKSLIDRHRKDDPAPYVPVFPKLKPQGTKGPTICSVDGYGAVTSPSGGSCLCPAGTTQAGLPPYGSSGSYYCSPA